MQQPSKIKCAHHFGNKYSYSGQRFFFSYWRPGDAARMPKNIWGQIYTGTSRKILTVDDQWPTPGDAARMPKNSRKIILTGQFGELERGIWKGKRELASSVPPHQSVLGRRTAMGGRVPGSLATDMAAPWRSQRRSLEAMATNQIAWGHGGGSWIGDLISGGASVAVWCF
jgi:hypothetical protein